LGAGFSAVCAKAVLTANALTSAPTKTNRFILASSNTPVLAFDYTGDRRTIAI
jgi:hypothetical protein